MKLNELQTRSFPLTYNEESNTVSVVFSTGSRVFRSGRQSYFEELEISQDAIDFSRLNAGASVLDSHNTDSVRNVIGVVENSRIENGEAIAAIRFSERDDVKGIVQDVRGGILKNISVGYSISKVEKRGEENGHPIYLAKRWQPAEISFVSIPADIDAQVRSEEIQDSVEPITTITKEQEMTEQEIKTEESRALPQINADEVIKAERARIGEITKLCRSANLTSDFAEKLIGDGATIESARSSILDEVIKNQAKISNTTTTVDAGEKFRSGIESAVEIRSGFAKDDSKNEFRGMTLVEMAKRSLELSGLSSSGTKTELVGRSFTSSSDFPLILANIANKSLKKGYEEANETWQSWTKTISVPDFKKQTIVSMSEFGLLDKTAELAEIKFAGFSEAKEEIQAETYTKGFGISRVAVVNDDLNAFTRAPAAMGAAAKRTLNKSVYDKLVANPSLISDSTAVFHANHNNILTGTITGGISVVELDKARTAMRKQKDIGGSAFLNISPNILLVPACLEGVARIITTSQYDPDAASKLQRVNMVYNIVNQIVVDPLLDANSQTAWYLVSTQYDGLVVAFLDGNTSPVFEQETSFTVDGVRMKVRLDWGVAFVDYRPVLKHVGA